MRERSDHYQVQVVSATTSKKRLGSYLVEAGLLTTAQLDVALNDQRVTEQTTGTHMQLGEILAARGWLKEQTIEYVMEKVVLPERRALKQPLGSEHQLSQQAKPNRTQSSASETRQSSQDLPQANSAASDKAASSGTHSQSFVRREAPISKPLPPVKSTDGDVNWVG